MVLSLAGKYSETKNNMLCRTLAGIGIILSIAQAQDTRKVTEPVIPRSCAVVTANLTAVDGRTLAEADESKLDTQRIQRAIDACQQGQAVELKAAGARNAFLSGPLQLRAGVTLLVDASAILFG